MFLKYVNVLLADLNYFCVQFGQSFRLRNSFLGLNSSAVGSKVSVGCILGDLSAEYATIFLLGYLEDNNLLLTEV